jgi:hypothetical protein
MKANPFPEEYQLIIKKTREKGKVILFLARGRTAEDCRPTAPFPLEMASREASLPRALPAIIRFRGQCRIIL